MGSCLPDVPEESADTTSIPSSVDDGGVGVGTESPTRRADSVAVVLGSGDGVSVGAATGGDSTPSPADDVGVGVDTESSTGGADSVAVGFRSGGVDSVGAAMGWSMGEDGPHPGRTVVAPDTRATMASRTTSFLISLHLYGTRLCSGVMAVKIIIGSGISETPREGVWSVQFSATC